MTELAVFDRLVQTIKPDIIVAENYRIYGHKLKQHTNSTVPTIQYIGAIKLIAQLRGVPCVWQMAFQAKGFATDTRLESLGLFQTAKRHANDAIRHGVYFYVFGKVPPEPTNASVSVAGTKVEATKRRQGTRGRT